MIDDDFIPFFVTLLSGITIGLFLGLVVATVTERGATEKKTVVYCVEQPSACKVKYDYYKLENQK